MVTTNVNSSEGENVYEIILYGIEVRINELIFVGKFSAIRGNDEATQGYYLVEWLSEPYIV